MSDLAEAIKEKARAARKSEPGVRPDEREERSDEFLIGDNVRKRRYEVDQNFKDWRLDNFLQNRIGSISRTRAGEIAKHGDVVVLPPRKIKAGTVLRDGDIVIVREHLDPEWVQDPQVDVIHADEALVIVGKPSGMLVHEVGPVRLNTVKKFCQREGWEDVEPAHRIDKETSGVVVMARGDYIEKVVNAFKFRTTDKTYRALVLDPDGVWTEGERRTLDTPLGEDADSSLRIKQGPGDKRAVSHVHVRRRFSHEFGEMADLEVNIETGRQHQIRAHLALEGTPIAGDKLYTFDEQFFRDISNDPDDAELRARLPFDRHALHAWKLVLPHPKTHQDVEFKAPLPPIFSR